MRPPAPGLCTSVSSGAVSLCLAVWRTARKPMKSLCSFAKLGLESGPTGERENVAKLLILLGLSSIETRADYLTVLYLGFYLFLDPKPGSC